jgi:hypothetical protein
MWEGTMKLRILFGLLVLGLLAAGTMARGRAAARPPGQQAGELVQDYSVTVRASGLEPSHLTLPLDVPVHVGIVNLSGAPCLFLLGDYLWGLLLASSTNGEVTFVAPAPSGSRVGAADEIRMGCMGDPQRRGTVSFQETAGDPAALPGAAPLAPPATDAMRVPITLRADGVEPSAAAIPTGTPIRLEVRNEGPPCLFYFGDYLQGLLIPSGRFAVAVFVAIARSGSARGAADELTMGCVGDPSRQGAVSITRS